MSAADAVDRFGFDADVGRHAFTRFVPELRGARVESGMLLTDGRIVALPCSGIRVEMVVDEDADGGVGACVAVLPVVVGEPADAPRRLAVVADVR